MKHRTSDSKISSKASPCTDVELLYSVPISGKPHYLLSYLTVGLHNGVETLQRNFHTLVDFWLFHFLLVCYEYFLLLVSF
jgi:hypothetical protein